MKYITYFIINTLFLVVCFFVQAEDAEKNIDVKKINDVVSEEKSMLKNDESLNDADGTDEDDEHPSAKEEEENDDANEEEADERPEVEDKKYDDTNDEQEESNEITNLKEQKSSAITLEMVNYKINQLKKSIEVENKAYVMQDKDKNLKILDSIMELIKDETDTDSDKETALNEEDEAKEELNGSEEDLDKEDDDSEEDTEEDDIVDKEDE